MRRRRGVALAIASCALRHFAIDVRLTPPRLAGRDDHDRKIETRIARQWARDQAIEAGHHPRDRRVPGGGGVVDMRDRGLHEVTGGLHESHIHRIHQHQPTDLFAIQVAVHDRQQSAVGVTDHQPAGRCAESLERRIQLAHLLLGREIGWAHLAPAEPGTIVGDDRSPGAPGERRVEARPGVERGAATGLHHDRERAGPAMHDEMQAVAADIEQGVLGRLASEPTGGELPRR